LIRIPSFLVPFGFAAFSEIDNVKLQSVQAVPEPSATLLLVTAMLFAGIRSLLEQPKQRQPHGLVP
jgi:hypothetical protein